MYHQYREGWIEVISGCMFAGKTEELIRRINVLSYAKKNIIVFKPKIDNRYSDSEIVSHSGAKVPCLVVEKAQDILKKIEADTEVVAIDEVQFFDQSFAERFPGVADNHINAFEVIGRFDHIIHIDNAILHTDGVGFIDIARLVMRQPTAFDMIGVIGQLDLHLVIDAAGGFACLFTTQMVE